MYTWCPKAPPLEVRDVRVNYDHTHVNGDYENLNAKKTVKRMVRKPTKYRSRPHILAAARDNGSEFSWHVAYRSVVRRYWNFIPECQTILQTEDLVTFP